MSLLELARTSFKWVSKQYLGIGSKDYPSEPMKYSFLFQSNVFKKSRINFPNDIFSPKILFIHKNFWWPF